MQKVFFWIRPANTAQSNYFIVQDVTHSTIKYASTINLPMVNFCLQWRSIKPQDQYGHQPPKQSNRCFVFRMLWACLKLVHWNFPVLAPGSMQLVATRGHGLFSKASTVLRKDPTKLFKTNPASNQKTIPIPGLWRYCRTEPQKKIEWDVFTKPRNADMSRLWEWRTLTFWSFSNWRCSNSLDKQFLGCPTSSFSISCDIAHNYGMQIILDSDRPQLGATCQKESIIRQDKHCVDDRTWFIVISPRVVLLATWQEAQQMLYVRFAIWGNKSGLA